MRSIRLRGLLADGAALLLLIGAIAGVALGFAMPWLNTGPASDTGIARYVLPANGGAALQIKRDPNDQVISWHSQNTALLAGLRALSVELRPGTLNAIEQFYLREGETEIGADQWPERLTDVEIIRLQERTLEASGALSSTTSVSVRDRRGEFLVNIYTAADGTDLTFDPPMQTLPGEMAAGSDWDGAGTVSETFGYAVQGEVLTAGVPFPGNPELSDCLHLNVHLTLTSGEQVLSDQVFDDWYCAGVGLIQSEEKDAGGQLISRTSLADPETAAALLSTGSPTGPDATPVALPAADNWTHTRFGRTSLFTDSSESTILPTWVPGNQPLLLAAGYGGDLIAYDASDSAGTPVWTFHPGGMIYGRPAYSPEHDRIYFGSTDKRLYALDRRGLFLWSFQIGDNIAGQPVVTNGLVVFGSEDRAVYALDAITGTERWSFETGGAVVSSPAAFDELVIIGSDDGIIYGLEHETGRQVWAFPTAGAIEAPVVANGEHVFAVSRAGVLVALDAASGDEIWSTDTPGILRTAPAVDDQHVVIINDQGRLFIFDRATGEEVASTSGTDLEGPPVLWRDAIFVSTADGELQQRSMSGGVSKSWPASEVTSPTDLVADTDFGPVLGGDALWLADRNATIRRLGPSAGPATATYDWIANLSDLRRFSGNTMTAGAVEYDGKAVMIDDGHTIFLIDPASGSTTSLGQIEDAAGTHFLEPVVAGHTLLASSGTTLHAVSLPDARTLWDAELPGIAYSQPVVEEDIALLMTGGTDSESELQAFSLTDGSTLWQIALPGDGITGGIEVRNGIVYTTTPVMALDARTGQALWSAPESLLLGAGRPAVDQAGERVFVAGKDQLGDGWLAAFSVGQGEPLWLTPIPADTIGFFDRVWLEDDTVIVPLLSGDIAAYSAENGAQLWQFTPPAARFGSVTVADGLIWLITMDARVIGLNPLDGQPVARQVGLELDLSLASDLAQRPVFIGGYGLAPLSFRIVGFEQAGAARQ